VRARGDGDLREKSKDLTRYFVELDNEYPDSLCVFGVPCGKKGSWC
jgi:hypothetical protein